MIHAGASESRCHFGHWDIGAATAAAKLCAEGSQHPLSHVTALVAATSWRWRSPHRLSVITQSAPPSYTLAQNRCERCNIAMRSSTCRSSLTACRSPAAACALSPRAISVQLMISRWQMPAFHVPNCSTGMLSRWASRVCSAAISAAVGERRGDVVPVISKPAGRGRKRVGPMAGNVSV